MSFTNKQLEFDFQEGEVLLFDKPAGWTSFDLVKKVRNLIKYFLGVKKIKVGHAGTLDPLATGLMILSTGKATKQIIRYQNLDKSYLAELEFGKTTPSFDSETDIDQTYPFDHITRKKLLEVLSYYTGSQEQLPPAYSAKNIDGERAYKLARRGEKVILKPQAITISRLELVYFNPPFCSLQIDCSKGTYVRSLVRDIGYSLNSGATMTALTRTRIGQYQLSESYTIKEFEKILQET